MPKDWNWRCPLFAAVFDLPKIEEEIKNLEEETANPSFWSDPKNAAKINGKLSDLNDKKNTYEGLFNRLEDIKAALSLLKEEDDKDLHNQTEKDVASLSKDMDAFETELYLSGAYDHMNAILEFHPGAGGTEAHDWAGMLFRMYTNTVTATDSNIKYWIIKKAKKLEYLLPH